MCKMQAENSSLREELDSKFQISQEGKLPDSIKAIQCSLHETKQQQHSFNQKPDKSTAQGDDLQVDNSDRPSMEISDYTSLIQETPVSPGKLEDLWKIQRGPRIENYSSVVLAPFSSFRFLKLNLLLPEPFEGKVKVLAKEREGNKSYWLPYDSIFNSPLFLDFVTIVDLSQKSNKNRSNVSICIRYINPKALSQSIQFQIQADSSG
jgi:hypothetical protein